MNEHGGINWRILVIEDKENIAAELKDGARTFVNLPDTAEAETCTRFKDAPAMLDAQRYDVVVIDLKDDSGWFPPEEELPGLRIYESLKQRRFVPVVFYTALPSHVLPEQSAFVRVVEKTAGLPKLREEIRRVLDTKLPAFTRHIEEVQRSYMWDFVSAHWKEMAALHQKVDLVYLVARRLAQTLRGDSIRSFVSRISGKTQTADGTSPAVEPPIANVASTEADDTVQVSDAVHPVELYIYPCEGQPWLAGDILQAEMNGPKGYWLVLTPSCDFENSKAQFVILAKCEHLTEQEEYGKWAANTKQPSKGVLRGMEAIIGDNRGGQKERFKFLPGTFFLPDLVVDFQQLRSVPLADLKREWVVASLDSPFAEAVLARFSRYFGRLGTPNIDKDVVINRLQVTATSSSPAQASPPPAA